MSGQPRVVRDPSGPSWQATLGGEDAGTAKALVRPDGRTFVFLRSVQPGAYEPLLAAVASEFTGPLYANIDLGDTAALDELRRLGFEEARRESNFIIPVEGACARLRSARLPPGFLLVSAGEVPEDELRELDDALRQDVPGLDGWQWDAAGFHEETYVGDAFDPELYWVAVADATGEKSGIVRVWANREAPRLGLIAVSAACRGKGLAKAMLAHVFGVLQRRGAPEVTTETDDLNVASRQLLVGIGAVRVGGFAEMVRHRWA